MLLPREQSPWNCGYFFGAIALKALKSMPQGCADLLDLKGEMEKLMGREVSSNQVVMGTAWLYLIGAIEADGDGKVRRCNS